MKRKSKTSPTPTNAEPEVDKKQAMQKEQQKNAKWWDNLLNAIPNEVYFAVCVLPVCYVAYELDNFLIRGCLIISVLIYFPTNEIIPVAGTKLIDKLNGIDLGKPIREPPIPQSLGLISGTSFLISLVFIQTIIKYQEGLSESYYRYSIMMLSVCFSILLGLADDVMNIRWRDKLFIGLIASIPLISSYNGATSILFPSFARFLIDSNSPLHYFLKTFLNVYPSLDGKVIELGSFYLVYAVALVVFCTNAINIYAGINGLETGQSIIIAIGVILMDYYEISSSSVNSTHHQNHVFSMSVMIPFLFSSLSLLKFNFFPAKVFIGDVFPYYAGMSFAATAILGHWSRTLLLLLIPQVLNYLYSLPQLFGYVNCPRHRLPKVNTTTGLLEPSKSIPGDDSSRNNMTLICLALEIFGPMRERTLTIILLLFQVICVGFGLAARIVLAKVFFS